MWADKRSATTVSLSLSFTGPNNADGYATVETSNAPENYNVTYGSGPLLGPNPPDVITYPGSSITLTNNSTPARWDITTSARWVRVRFVPISSVSNLSAYVWCNIPFQSP